MHRRIRLAALLATLLLVTCATASAQAATVTIFLLQGEQLQPVERTVPAGVSTPLAAISELLAGPTTAERAAGYRTEIPRATQLLGYLRNRNGTTVVDLSRPFARSGTAASKSARLAQLVYTATELRGTDRVRLWLAHAPAKALGKDRRVAAAIGRSALQPTGGFPIPPVGIPGPSSKAVRAIQARLVELGYLASAPAPDGRLDTRTRNAVIAFQKWEGLAVDGIIGPQTTARIASATRPVPIEPAPVAGRRIEISLSHQVALLVAADGVVQRTISISTGRAKTPTPTGVFSVFRREERSWSVPFQRWLPYAAYFAGGNPIHAATVVPLTPITRGAVRVPWETGPEVYAFALLGTSVVVR